MKYIKENWQKWIARLLIIAILFIPQLFVQKQNWQTKGIFGLLSTAVVIFAFNKNIREIVVGKEGVSLKLLKLAEDTAAVKELGLGIMKSMLMMLAFDDNSWQTLTPLQKIEIYHNLMQTKDKLSLRDKELDKCFRDTQKSIIRGFIKSFESLPLEESDIVEIFNGNSVIHFEKLQKSIDGIQNEEYKNKYQTYYDTLISFTKEINY